MKDFCLFVAVFVLLFAGGVFGAGGDLGLGTEPLTDGSADYPWLIEDFADFEVFRQEPNCLAEGAYTKLMNDINLDPAIDGREVYTEAPIGFYYGRFDGNGHSISNMQIDGTHALGLFNHLMDTGSISNLSVNGTITSNGGLIGGMCAKNHSGTIINCFADVSITSTMTNYNYIGGFVGECSYGTIKNCYSTGDVSGRSVVGGFAGDIKYDASVKYCYSTGRATNAGLYSISGGFCGVVDSDIDLSTCFWDVQTSGIEYNPEYDKAIGLSTEQMQNPETFKDRMWWFADPQTGRPGDWYMSEGEYPRLTVFGVEGTSAVPKVEGLNEAQCRDALADAGFTVGDVYYVNSLTVDPCMVTGLSVSEAGLVYTGNPIDIFISMGLSGDGSEGDPWPVACAADMEYINNDLTACYYITKDIYFAADNIYSTAVVCPNRTGPYYPVKFSGTFDGQNYSVVNLVMKDNHSLGLFGWIDNGGTVKNLTIENYWISCDLPFPRAYFGSICFINYGKIINCKSFGEISGVYGVGGICGDNKGIISNVFSDVRLFCNFGGDYHREAMGGGICGRNSGTISDSRSISNVESDYAAGGLCGYNYGIISRSNSTGYIKGGWFSGGICGRNHDTMNDCFANGKVDSGYYLGGLCGFMNSGNITNCYSASEIVSEGNGMFGGYGDGNIVNCFWDAEKDGLDETSPGDTNEGAVGKSTAEMQAISTFTDAGWDFVGESVNGDEDVWRLCVDGSGYPRLAWEYYSVGDFVCGDGVDMDDFAYFSARDYCDGCGGIFGAAGGVVDVELLARIASRWLDVGCGDCGGGDVSGDGSVGLADVSKASGQWGCSAAVNWDRCDLDGDGVVGDLDFDIWIGYWLD